MTPPEPGTLDVVLKLAPIIAASGIWVFGAGILVQNWRRAKAERRRAEADQRRAEAEKDRHTESMEADRHRHEEAMTALIEIIRRMSPPSSPPQPGPAE